jgi:hypothetical protein
MHRVLKANFERQGYKDSCLFHQSIGSVSDASPGFRKYLSISSLVLTLSFLYIVSNNEEVVA